MKKNQVNMGDVFGVKVSGRVVPVKILGKCWNGGWNGWNQRTRRQVRIRTAGRLRFKIAEYNYSTDTETNVGKYSVKPNHITYTRDCGKVYIVRDSTI